MRLTVNFYKNNDRFIVVYLQQYNFNFKLEYYKGNTMKKLFTLLFLFTTFSFSYAEEKIYSLEDDINWKINKMNCDRVKTLHSQIYPYTYKDEDAVERCKIEQHMLKVISKDDLNTFKQITSGYEGMGIRESFTLWNYSSSYIALKPANIAVITNSSKIFDYIMDYYKNESYRDDYVEGSRKIFSYNFEFGLNGIDPDEFDQEFTLVGLCMVYNRPEMLKKLVVSVQPLSLTMANDMQNVFYIGKFATPNLYDIYIKALKQKDLADNFLYEDIFEEAVRENNIKLIEHMVKSKHIDLNEAKKYSDNTFGVDVLYHALLHENMDVAAKLIELGTLISQKEVDRIAELKEQGLWKKELPKATK